MNMHDETIKKIKQSLDKNFDISYRDIPTGRGVIHIIYDGVMCNSEFVSQFILNPLMKAKDIGDNLEQIVGEILPANDISSIESVDTAIIRILSGDVVILFPGIDKIVVCDAKGYVTRAIDIPITETVLKGPREGFTEDIVTSVTQVRRRLSTPLLKFEIFEMGTKSKNMVVMCYIEGMTPPRLIELVKKSINEIKQDFVLYSNIIEEKLRAKHTSFDTIGYTEKPDVAANKLAEGRIVILIDGTPIAITVPYFFIEYFQTPDDYYLNKYVSNITRILRWLAFGIATLLPGFYIALVCYHPSLIPTIFVFRFAAARAGIPFPTSIEVIMLFLFFMLIREGSVRLPHPLGSSISIVGALILGDSLVSASLASNITLIIMALSSICSFLVPKIYGAITIWNLIIIIFSSLIGLPGFYVSFILMVSHIASLDSCGYPFLYPLGTLKVFNFKDILIRDDLDKISNSLFERNEDA
jgi:spore germination protein KA